MVVVVVVVVVATGYIDAFVILLGLINTDTVYVAAVPSSFIFEALCFFGLPGEQANFEALRLTFELTETIVNVHLKVLPLILSDC